MIVSRKMAEDASKDLLLHAMFLGDHLTEEAVRQSYRSLVKETHPDVEGGSVEDFARVDRAKHVLLKWLEQPKSDAPVHKRDDCVQCSGMGYVLSARGFKSMRIQCPKCRGTGDGDYEHERGMES